MMYVVSRQICWALPFHVTHVTHVVCFFAIIRVDTVYTCKSTSLTVMDLTIKNPFGAVWTCGSPEEHLQNYWVSYRFPWLCNQLHGMAFSVFFFWDLLEDHPETTSMNTHIEETSNGHVVYNHPYASNHVYLYMFWPNALQLITFNIYTNTAFSAHTHTHINTGIYILGLNASHLCWLSCHKGDCRWDPTWWRIKFYEVFPCCCKTLLQDVPIQDITN